MATTHQMHSVPAKIYRTPLRIMAAIPMPGMEPADISVEVTQSPALVIRGRQRGEPVAVGPPADARGADCG